MSLISTFPSGTPGVGPVKSQVGGAGGTNWPKNLATRAMSLMSVFPSGQPVGPVMSPTLRAPVEFH